MAPATDPSGPRTGQAAASDPSGRAATPEVPVSARRTRASAAGGSAPPRAATTAPVRSTTTVTPCSLTEKLAFGVRERRSSRIVSPVRASHALAPAASGGWPAR